MVLTIYICIHADSSSSEYDSELQELEDNPNFSVTVDKNEQCHSLIRWFVVFICMWQTMFTISDVAVTLLLKFLAAFFQLMASLTSTPLFVALAAGMPATMYLMRKYLKSDSESITKYVVCPSCFSLYQFERCFHEDSMGEKLPKKCWFVKFPNHPQLNCRLPCSTPLLTKVHMSGGKVKYVPRYSYAYQSLKVSLQRLLYRSGFAEQPEHWLNRQYKEGFMSDVYDGKVWKDFNSEKYSNFLRNNRCYGLMLNFDFFQPYKHSPDSYGVFYMTLMNLPRAERFKQENVLLVE